METENGEVKVTRCTVVSSGYCSGGTCVLHGACPHEKAILEASSSQEGE